MVEWLPVVEPNNAESLVGRLENKILFVKDKFAPRQILAKQDIVTISRSCILMFTLSLYTHDTEQ